MNQPRRRPNLASSVLAAITVSLALITLFGLAPFPFLPDVFKSSVNEVSQTLVQLVTVVGALAVIIGIFNLLAVHARKIAHPPAGIYSLITILTLVIIVVLRLVERLNILQVGSGDSPALTLTLMDAVQVTIESALAGLLFFFLVYSAYRLMRRRVTVWNLLFVATLILVLVGYTQPTGSLLANVREWILRVPVGAGTRGLLIGIAIGTVVVGTRLLIGQDRTFRG